MNVGKLTLLARALVNLQHDLRRDHGGKRRFIADRDVTDIFAGVDRQIGDTDAPDPGIPQAYRQNRASDAGRF